MALVGTQARGTTLLSGNSYRGVNGNGKEQGPPVFKNPSRGCRVIGKKLITQTRGKPVAGGERGRKGQMGYIEIREKKNLLQVE